MPSIAYFEGKFVPIAEAKVSIMTHALNYGTGVFEGIRAYWNADQEQLYAVRLRDHYRRLLQSTKVLRMQFDLDAEQMSALTVELLRREGYREDTYIRPLAYKANEIIGVRLHNLRDEFAIFSVPFGKYIEQQEGAKVCISSWRRNDDNAIPPRGKITGSYVNSALIKSEALLNGYDEAMVLNADGHLSEGSAENLFIVRGGKLITPPVSANILEGITRQLIINLAKDELGVETVERQIDRTEVYIADEAFFCGTGVEVTPIGSVDQITLGTGVVGPITRRIRELYFRIVRGDEPRYMDLLTPIYQK
jgi:branched-chain amino acid aminotransferase